MDDDGNRRLDKKEFKKGVHDYGLDIPNDVAEQIFGIIDCDNNGAIDFDEFLKALRVSSSHISTHQFSVSNVSCLSGWSTRLYTLYTYFKVRIPIESDIPREAQASLTKGLTETTCQTI